MLNADLRVYYSESIVFDASGRALDAAEVPVRFDTKTLVGQSLEFEPLETG